MSFMDKLQIPGGGAAFDNLTTTKMARFNDTTPDVPSVSAGWIEYILCLFYKLIVSCALIDWLGKIL